MKEIKTCVAYYRVSSDKKEDGYSIETQSAFIHHYCELHGIKIVKKYEDFGFTGTNIYRPDFQKMLNDLLSKNIHADAVIVYDLSRFSRDLTDANLIEDKLNENNIQIISVSENIDSSSNGKFMKNVINAMNEKYVDDLSRRIKDSNISLHENGKFQGGFAPYGYEIDINKDFQIVGYEAENVKVIFNMYVNNHSMKDIIAELNKRNAVTRFGNPFTKSSIQDILKNEIYCGIYVYDKSKKVKKNGIYHYVKNSPDEYKRIEDKVPAIISRELFQKAMEKRTKNQKGTKLKKKKNTYLFSGMIQCADCSSNFTGNTHTNFQNGKAYTSISYQCSSKHKGCRCNSINANQLETYVIKMFIKIFFSTENINQLYYDFLDYMDNQNDSDKNILKQLENDKKSVKKKIEHLLNVIEKNEEHPKSLINRLNEKEKLLYDIEDQIDELKNKETNNFSLDDFKNLISFANEQLLLKNVDLIKPLIDEYIQKISVNEDEIILALNIDEIKPLNYMNQIEVKQNCYL